MNDLLLFDNNYDPVANEKMSRQYPDPDSVVSISNWLLDPDANPDPRIHNTGVGSVCGSGLLNKSEFSPDLPFFYNKPQIYPCAEFQQAALP